MLQQQILEAEKVRKINFTRKHDEFQDKIDHEDDLLVGMQN